MILFILGFCFLFVIFSLNLDLNLPFESCNLQLRSCKYVCVGFGCKVNIFFKFLSCKKKKILRIYELTGLTGSVTLYSNPLHFFILFPHPPNNFFLFCLIVTTSYFPSSSEFLSLASMAQSHTGGALRIP